MVEKTPNFSGKEQAKAVSELKAKLESIADSLDATSNMLAGRAHDRFFIYIKETTSSLSEIFRRPFDKKVFESNGSKALAAVSGALSTISSFDGHKYTRHNQLMYAEILSTAANIEDGLHLLWYADQKGSGILHPDLPPDDALLLLFVIPKVLSLEISSIISEIYEDSTYKPSGYKGPGVAIHKEAVRQFERSLELYEPSPAVARLRTEQTV